MSTKRSPENKNWRQVIQEDVECEGFDYAFIGYDDYKWVNDAELHEKIKSYLKSREELGAFVGIPEENML